MDLRGLLDRARSARLARVLIVYVIASFGVLEVVDILSSQFGLPAWFFPAGIALLLIGLPIISATALMQAGTRVDHGLHGIELPAQERRTPWHAPEQWFTWKRAILGGVLAFTALGSVGLGLISLRNRGRELQPDVVAVLPFHVVGEGVELWREGLVDLLATALDGTGEFRSSDPRAVLNRWSKVVGSTAELPEPDRAAEVAGALGAGRMILGSVITTGGGDVRVIADLYSVRWLRKEGAASVEGSEDDMPNLIDRLTVDLLKSVWRGEGTPEVRVSGITTSSIPALRAYLEGEQAFRRSQFDKSQEAFTLAIEADSTFAIALYRLSLSYGWRLAGTGEAAKYGAAAARHSAGLPERDSLQIAAYNLLGNGDLVSMQLFERLTFRYPDDLEAWYGLGEAYVHIGAAAGLPRTRPLEAFKRAVKLDSSFAPALIHMVEIAHSEDDSVNATNWTGEYLALDSTSEFAEMFQVATPLRFGPPEDSVKAAEALKNVDYGVLSELLCTCFAGASSPGTYEMVALAAASPRFPDAQRANAMLSLGMQYLRRGQVTRAIELVREGQTLSPRNWRGPYLVAMARLLGLADDPASEQLLDRLARRSNFFAVRNARGRLAAAEGRIDEAVAMVASLDSNADSLMAVGDSTRARSMRGLALAVRGHIAMAGDSVDAATAHFQRGLSLLNANLIWSRDLDRFWLATLIQDKGGEEEALEIYGSIYWTPWLEALGYLKRAELHERRGDIEDAVQFYARFLELWANADPHLQPQVESARRAMQRLTAEGATS